MTTAMEPGTRAGRLGLIWFILTLPLLLTLWGIVEVAMAKPLYNVMIESATGEQLVYASEDEDIIVRIVAAITDGIVARG